MKAIALDPDYARKMSRRFVAGGLAGHLYYNTKKWFGYRDQVCTSLLTNSMHKMPCTFWFLEIKKNLTCFLGLAFW